jgi:hypothetical protein
MPAAVPLNVDALSDSVALAATNGVTCPPAGRAPGRPGSMFDSVNP